MRNRELHTKLMQTSNWCCVCIYMYIYIPVIVLYIYKHISKY